MAKSFREACCERLGLPEEAFEETVLWQCLPPQHVPVGKLRWRFDRAYFRDDLELIHLVGDCTSLRDLMALCAYHRFGKPVTGLERRLFRARLSGQRLVNFASRFLPKSAEAATKAAGVRTDPHPQTGRTQEQTTFKEATNPKVANVESGLNPLIHKHLRSDALPGTLSQRSPDHPDRRARERL